MAGVGWYFIKGCLISPLPCELETHYQHTISAKTTREHDQAVKFSHKEDIFE